jgi:hypothetical protein
MVITVAAGNVLVITLARRLGLAHFVARVERAARPTLTLHLLAAFAGPSPGPSAMAPRLMLKPSKPTPANCQMRDFMVFLSVEKLRQRQSTAPITQAN